MHPAYDPRYFEDEAGKKYKYKRFIAHLKIFSDLGALIETVKFARKVCQTTPFKDVLGATLLYFLTFSLISSFRRGAGGSQPGSKCPD